MSDQEGKKLSVREWISIGILLVAIVSFAYWKAESEFYKSEVREWTIGFLFPATVGGASYLLSQQAEKERESQREQEALRLREQQEQAELKDYFDRITNLILKNYQICSGSKEFQIIQALTVNVLREVNASRMNQIIYFLWKMNLCQVGGNDSICRCLKLDGANLERLSAFNVDFRESTFTNAKLQGADFLMSDFKNAIFWAAELDNVSFKAVNLDGADFCGASFKNADFTGASLIGTRFLEGEGLSQEQASECQEYSPQYYSFNGLYEDLQKIILKKREEFSSE